MAITLNDNIRANIAKPLEDKRMNNGVPYTSVAQANSLLNPVVDRYESLEVVIGTPSNWSIYWYKGGTADPDLILKEEGGAGLGVWDNTKTYSKDDAVLYEDPVGYYTLYVAKQPSTGAVPPTSTGDWGVVNDGALETTDIPAQDSTQPFNAGGAYDLNQKILDAQAAADVAQEDIDAHELRTDNPHNVTKGQVGLPNVPNVDTTIAANISISSSAFIPSNNVIVAGDNEQIIAEKTQGQLNVKLENPSYKDTSVNLYGFGDSFVEGFGIPTPANRFINITATSLGKSLTNFGASGSGFDASILMSYIQNYELPDNQTNRTGTNVVFCGLNNISLSSNKALTKSTVFSYITAFLANQFIGQLILAADMTSTTNWVAMPSPNTFVNKSYASKEARPAPRYSNNNTDSISAQNVRINNGLVIGWIAGSSSVVRGELEVYVNGTLVATIDQSNQADGNTFVTNSSGFSISANTQTSKATVIWNIPAGYYTIMLKAKTNGVYSTVDYIGTLADPILTKPVMFGDVPHLSNTGWSTSNPSNPATNNDADDVSAIIRSAVNEFVTRGYPVEVMPTNTYLIQGTDFQPDQIHPNTLGNQHIADGFIATFASILTKRSPFIKGLKDYFAVYSSDGTLSFSTLKQSTTGNRVLINDAVDDSSTPLQIAGNLGTNVVRVADGTNANLFRVERTTGDIYLKSTGRIFFGNTNFFIAPDGGLSLNAINFLEGKVNSASVYRVFQNGGIVIGGGNGSQKSSVALEITGTTKGILPSRINTGNRDVMSSTVQDVTIVNGGTGYTSAPTITASGGGGTGATFTVTVLGGVIQTVTVTNGGSGYTSPPTLNITGGGGSGGVIQAGLLPNSLVIHNTTTNRLNQYVSGSWKEVAFRDDTTLVTDTSATPPSNSSLNSDYPNTNIGFRVYFSDAGISRIYTKVTSTNWVFAEVSAI